jgi:hypothetical protein
MPSKSKPDSGALTIAPPDGYKYGDDHAWTADDQKKLADDLNSLWKSLRTSKTP